MDSSFFFYRVLRMRWVSVTPKGWSSGCYVSLVGCYRSLPRRIYWLGYNRAFEGLWRSFYDLFVFFFSFVFFTFISFVLLYVTLRLPPSPLGLSTVIDKFKIPPHKDSVLFNHEISHDQVFFFYFPFPFTVPVFFFFFSFSFFSFFLSIFSVSFL
ncbi:hypothetical protein BZA77DRAFT_84629 [Pyronema omphalodes]|nr:hypothetical protein BZA77DRAFT_84629 [Pyronema omphalodes]